MKHKHKHKEVPQKYYFTLLSQPPQLKQTNLARYNTQDTHCTIHGTRYNNFSLSHLYYYYLVYYSIQAEQNRKEHKRQNRMNHVNVSININVNSINDSKIFE